MYKIKVAKYKHSKSKFASFIRMQQRLQDLGYHAQYSHAEIFLSPSPLLEALLEKVDILNKDNFNSNKENKTKLIKAWVWFSSSESDWWTRFKFIEDNKWNWDYDELEVTAEQYKTIVQACIDRNYRRYGWGWIIFTQALKTLWFKNNKAPFCSQVVLEVLQEIWLFAWFNSIETNPWKLSRLTTNIQTEHKKIKSLYN